MYSFAKGILKGNCIILVRLEKAKPTVTERLKSLLDVNPEIVNVLKINQNFIILVTIKGYELNKASPALINIYITVYLDNQLGKVQKEDFNFRTSYKPILIKTKFILILIRLL